MFSSFLPDKKINIDEVSSSISVYAPSSIYIADLVGNFKIKYSPKIIWGAETNFQSLLSELSNLDLFSVASSYLIYDFDKIKERNYEKIASVLSQDGSNALLTFSNKLEFNKLKKLKPKFDLIEFKHFNFWDNQKIINFFEEILASKISRSLAKYVETFPKDDLEKILNYLKRLQIRYSSLDLDIAKFEQDDFYTSLNVFDEFDLLLEKKFSEVQFKMCNLYNNANKDSIFSLIGFFRSCIYKSFDLDLLKSKSKLSLFDKKIISLDERFDQFEREDFLKTLSEIEIELKKDEMFLERLKVLL